MTYTKHLVSLVAVLALAVFLASSVSAFASITNVEVSGVDAVVGGANTNANISAFAGQTLPVRVIFTATSNASDARVKVWISGDRDYSVSSERFDVLAGGTYSKLMSVQVPFDIDPEEALKLEVSVESKNNGEVSRKQVALAAQRESYLVEILDVSLNPNVKAGENLAVDVVLKNRGRQDAQDTFVRATIPTLNVERKAYFGDLTPIDQPIRAGSTDRLNKEDAAAGRMYLPIPANTPAGIYVVQFEAFNADSSTTVTKKIAVVGAESDSVVVSPVTSKNIAVGESGMYAVTVVNSGNKVRVYDVGFEAPSGLTLEADEPVFAVPSGASKTIKVTASADKAGKYTFVANINADGELVKKESFVANVEGASKSSNATVVLTVVLAIVFVVLLVVLIVLLTKKPQKTEEFGESYY